MSESAGAEPEAKPAGSGGGAPGSGGTTPTGGGSKFGTGALVATGLIALVVGAGGGYAIGHSKGEDSGKEDGIAQGKAEEAAKYEPGKPSYVAIYNAGRVVGARRGERRGDRRGLRAGKVVGFQKGEKVGVAKGEQEGAVTGANAALGGLSNWENGALYIVTTGPGNGVPTAIAARHQMVAGNNYKLCKKNPEKLCESPEQ